jgi:hypothetical protein
MNRPHCTLALALAALISCSSAVHAAAHIEFIDTGTPKSGNLEMTGWRGVIIRGIIDDKPITGFDFGDASPQFGQIAGNMAQRWTDPTGQGNYTVTSPGPSPANNSFDSDFNFDSHFLGTPQTYSSTTRVAETSLSGFYPQRTGIPSDGFVGYGATLPQSESDPFLYTRGTHMAGRFEVFPQFQNNAVDIAYVVVDGPFALFGNLFSGQQEFSVSANYPEPSSIGFLAVGAATVLLRRRLATEAESCKSERITL